MGRKKKVLRKSKYKGIFEALKGADIYQVAAEMAEIANKCKKKIICLNHPVDLVADPGDKPDDILHPWRTAMASYCRIHPEALKAFGFVKKIRPD